MNYAAPDFESKICPPDQLAARAAAIARPLVFTNGCFDILHCGHVTYLRRIKAGPFTADQAISLDKLNEIGKGARLQDYLLPLEAGLANQPMASATSTG